MSTDIERGRYQCPHCGELFDALRDGLIPTHDYPRPCRSVCPGSRQYPRNPETDKRPLWKDGGREEPDYETIIESIRTAPLTFLPALLAVTVETCVARNVFQAGRLVPYVERAAMRAESIKTEAPR